jgi:anti-sigma regulatory factor (Ser/Thr protein kinase)
MTGNETYRHVLQLELPMAHSAVTVARKAVKHFARLLGVASREVDTLRLVASELLANAVDHGGGQHVMHARDAAPDAIMRLDFDLSPTTWRLSVTDCGGGDPEEVRKLIAPDGMPDLEDERGRGLFLMASMVDTLDVERSADGRGLVMIAVRKHVAS